LDLACPLFSLHASFYQIPGAAQSNINLSPKSYEDH
jgi:hypothetical protein